MILLCTYIDSIKTLWSEIIDILLFTNSMNIVWQFISLVDTSAYKILLTAYLIQNESQ